MVIKIYIITLLIIASITHTASSQIEGGNSFLNYRTQDTNLMLMGESHTKFYYLNNGDILVFKSGADAKKFIDTTRSTSPFRFDEIDFSKNTLVLFSYHGSDCHARFRYFSDKNMNQKIFTVHVDIIYGGCRAAGNYMSTWGLIPKPEDDYKINFVTKHIDNFER
ncbi:MAG: hypothetical protein JST55_13455 [Bacteroidetes bacterium]|nr:hypothetical protein [Bacteroidota bacterium]